MNKYYLIFSVLLPFIVVAEEIVVLDKDMEQLLTLDLEELTTISIASKFEEKLQDAPGIVTVITDEEIKRYGARNLRDILDRQTHLQMVGSNLFPHGRVSMRGSTFTHVDNTVLPLYLI